MHIPVLLKESIEILDPKKGKFFIDGTIGGGGHSVEILKKIGVSGKLLGIDWDKDAIERLNPPAGGGKFKNYKNAILINGNYADLTEILEKLNFSKADGLIIDLGFSSDQLEKSGRAPNQSKLGTGRGFSFMRNEILDMRYNPTGEDLTAAEVVNSFSEKELADIFWKYGEEKYSRQIAKKIIEERKKKRILTAFELVEIIKKAVPKNYEPRSRTSSLRGRQGRIHPATKVFQALRIYVNYELDNLEKLLKNLTAILNSDGRVVIISFHSLEDRLVKNYFRQIVKEGKAEFLARKPIRPSIEEIKNNPRSRSAKLRAIKIK